jgi:predicted nucleic acid-binding protein
LILIDTSVVLDLLLDDPRWGSWSQAQLETLSATEQLAINDIVYTEASIGFQEIDALDAALASLGLQMAQMPREALFRAGKAFRKYKLRDGVKTGPLPDFFIGAHAAAEGWPLLTRDAARIRSYFPSVTLIAP